MLNSKSGMFNWDDPKTIANLIVGFIVLALGIIPILQAVGVIGWGLPGFINNIVGFIALYVIAGLGIWLLIDGFMEDETLRIVTIVVALVVLVLGIVPLLSQFGVIGEIPFIGVVFQPLVFSAIFVVEGIFLIIAAFATF